MQRNAIKLLAVIGVLCGGTALAACGESAQDKAKARVCDARNEISKQVAKLQGLTLSSNTVNEVKTSVEAIGDSLKKIKDAQPDLEPARKQQIETATKTFEAEVKTIATEVTSNLSASSLETGLKKAKSALGTLASDFSQTLGPVSCS